MNRATAPDRIRAWLVTGPLGRGTAFAIDFAIAMRTMLAQRRNRRDQI
jgi:transketolase